MIAVHAETRGSRFEAFPPSGGLLDAMAERSAKHWPVWTQEGVQGPVRAGCEVSGPGAKNRFGKNCSGEAASSRMATRGLSCGPKAEIGSVPPGGNQPRLVGGGDALLTLSKKLGVLMPLLLTFPGARVLTRTSRRIQ